MFWAYLKRAYLETGHTSIYGGKSTPGKFVMREEENISPEAGGMSFLKFAKKERNWLVAGKEK